MGSNGLQRLWYRGQSALSKKIFVTIKTLVAKELFSVNCGLIALH